MSQKNKKPNFSESPEDLVVQAKTDLRDSLRNFFFWFWGNNKDTVGEKPGFRGGVGGGGG